MPLTEMFLSTPWGTRTVHHNQSPNNTESNNDGTNATTIANAGIEQAYRDIKNFKIPATEIISTPRLTQKTALAQAGPVSLYRVYSLSGRYLRTVGLISQKAITPHAGGICLIRAENPTGGKYVSGVHKVLITK